MLLSTGIRAQINVSGYVTDAQTGEPVIGATVFCQSQLKGTTTNSFGYYSLNIKKDLYNDLTCSFVGYKQQFIKQNFIEDTIVNINLLPGLTIKEVNINGYIPIEKRSEVSTINLDIKDVDRLPALGGEVDLIKVLQLLPGVSRGNEGGSAMYVRGGSPDQNLILLDDVPLYYVNHLGGFVSTFNPDAINSVKLIKGGFPARYGSRLSSVLDIRMKNGDLNKRKGKATIGLVTTKFSLEGPLKKDTASYYISARRMMYDVLTRPLTPLLFNGVSMGYSFYDVNAKVNYKFGHKDRMYLSFYSGDDRSVSTFKDESIKSINKLRWGNVLGALKWNHVYSPKLFSNVTASYTQYRNSIVKNYKGSGLKSNYNFLSKVSDYTLKSDFELFAKSWSTVRAGGSMVYHVYTPTQIQNSQVVDGSKSDSTIVKYREEAFESNVYLENELTVLKDLIANVGIRYSNYAVKRNSFGSLEPRLALNYCVFDNHSIKIGYARMQQNVHLLTGHGVGMPNDYWLPATVKLKPEMSSQYSIGWSHTTKDNFYEMSIEVYYKEMSNQISFQDGIAYFSGTKNWQEQIDGDGEGIAKGIEFLIKKKKGAFTGWLGYTLSKTTRQFENQNGGKAYPFKYDRLHDISIVVQHQLTPTIDLFASWVYNTGNAITLSKEHYIVPHEVMYFEDDYPYLDVEIYGGRNSFRMKDYHRLDVGVNFTKKKKHGERVWSISVYNLYNRQNAYYYFWSSEFNEEYDHQGNLISDPQKSLWQQTLFPIIPSVSYSITF